MEEKKYAHMKPCLNPKHTDIQLAYICMESDC